MSKEEMEPCWLLFWLIVFAVLFVIRAINVTLLTET